MRYHTPRGLGYIHDGGRTPGIDPQPSNRQRVTAAHCRQRRHNSPTDSLCVLGCVKASGVRALSSLVRSQSSPLQSTAWSTTCVSPRGTLLPHTAAAAASGRRWYSGGVTTVETPEMGESITEGTYAATLKSVGDAVAVDDVVLQIETDKVTLDVRSPYNGALVEFLVEEGDTVTVGMPLFTIDQSAGACAWCLLCVPVCLCSVHVYVRLSLCATRTHPTPHRKEGRVFSRAPSSGDLPCTLLPLRR